MSITTRSTASSGLTPADQGPHTTPTPRADPASRIVIIGAGVVGAALADELVLRGFQHVQLVDQGKLWDTGGSSSHAPGFVFQTNPSRVQATLAMRTVEKLASAITDDGPVMDAVGGLEIATTPAQLAELRRRLGFARAWGIPAELIDGRRAAQLWPGLSTELVLGALHTPTDGVVHARRAVRFQGERAVAGGAQALELTRVIGVEQEAARVTGVRVVDAATGGDERVIEADVVVACGGIWGPELTRLIGMDVPMQPMEHGFAWTTPWEDLIAAGAADYAAGARRPIVRHQGAGAYFRDFGDRVGIGSYEHRPIPREVAELTDTAHMLSTGQHPAMREFTAQDFASTWEEVRRVVPGLAESQLRDAFNGLFSFTPDGGPLLGPSRTVDGFWVAQAVWVTQSVGCAQVMAQWLSTGNPGIDHHELDLNRFDPGTLSRAWVRQRGCESYDTVYDISFPRSSTSVQRGRKASPFYLRLQQAGAVFAEANDWERPLFYEENARLLTSAEFQMPDPIVPVHIPKRDAWDNTGWSPIVAAEAWRTRTAAGLFDMTALSRILVEGPGATSFLETVCSAKVGRAVGTVAYSLMLDERGGILSDVTVTRLGTERYLLGTNGPLDLDRMLRLRPHPGIHIDDITTSTCCLGLWGPAARRILAPLAEEDISHEALPYFRAKELFVAGVPVLALRVSYVGDLGWELYTDAAYGLRLFDEIRRAGAAHGLVLAGRSAFNSMRMEKGYRSYGSDMTREDSPDSSGLAFAVSPRKTGFIGYAAWKDEGASREQKHLATVLLRMDTGVPEPGSPVTTCEGEVVGWVTSAEFSYELGQVIAFVRVPEHLAQPHQELLIERFASQLRAVVVTDPVIDPEGARIRR